MEAKHDLGLPIFWVTEPYLVGGDWNIWIMTFHQVGTIIPTDFHIFQDD